MAFCHSLTGELYYKEDGLWSRLRRRRKHWYLLDETQCRLLCYRNQQEAGKSGTPINYFDISTSAIKLSLTDSNQFIITNSGKNHTFTAENHESMMVWVLAIQALRNSHITKMTKAMEDTVKGGQLDTRGNQQQYRPDSRDADALIVHNSFLGLSRKPEKTTEKAVDERPGLPENSTTTKLHLGTKMDTDYTYQQVAPDDVFEDDEPQTTSQFRKGILSRSNTLPDDGSTVSHGSIRKMSLSGRSTSSDSAFDRNSEGDLLAKVNDMEEELITVKCELAEMKNRESCYKAVLEKRDTIIIQLDEKLDYYQELQTDKKGAQTKLREQIRLLHNKNSFLNEEVNKLSEIRNKDQLAFDIQRRKCEDLEMTLTSWRQDYLYLLQTSINIPTGDLTDGYEVNLFGGNRHRERLKILLEEARAKNPSLPTFEKLAYSDVHIDWYGFKHRYTNEGQILHYIGHQLHSFYKMQLISYKEHKEQWRRVINNNKSALTITKELKSLVRKGIPPGYRKEIWKLLVYHHVSGIMIDKGPCYYSNLCRNIRDSDVAGRYRKQIFLDLLRTMPSNVNFSSASEKGTQKLQEVLLAFCVHNPSVGYCQGMNFIAAMALLFMDAEDAFWTLVAVTERYFSPSYFDAHLTGAQADQSVLKDIMRDQLPPLLQHLEELEIDISTVTLNWFLALFFDAVPFETLLRIWDCFLLEGPKVLLRVAIAILKINSEKLMKKTDTFSIMRHLKSCPGLMYDADGLIKVAFENLTKFPKRFEIENKRAVHMEVLKERLKKRTEQRRMFDDKNQLFYTLHDTADPERKQAFECATTCHQGLVWLCYGDQQVGKISLIDSDEVLMCNTDLELDSRIICACSVGQFILLGLLSGYLVLYHTKLRGEVWQIAVHDSVFSMCYQSEEGHSKKVFAGLANGTLAVLVNVCDAEPAEDPLYIHVGHGPVTSLCIINNQLLCASGSIIHILHADTLDIMDRLMVSSNPFDHVLSMAPSLAGLWVAIQGSSVVELWDPKLLTCKLLFDIKENRQVPIKKDEDGRLSTKRVTTILPVDDSLWVGTGEGTILIYDLVRAVSDESEKMSKYLYAKSPHTSRNRLHRNPEKMSACMKLKQSKLYSSSETDLRDIGLVGRSGMVSDAEHDSDSDVRYSAESLRHKPKLGRLDPDQRPIIASQSPRLKRSALSKSDSFQREQAEIRRHDFKKNSKSINSSMRKSRIPTTSFSDRELSSSADESPDWKSGRDAKEGERGHIRKSVLQRKENRFKVKAPSPTSPLALSDNNSISCNARSRRVTLGDTPSTSAITHDDTPKISNGSPHSPSDEKFVLDQKELRFHGHCQSGNSDDQQDGGLSLSPKSHQALLALKHKVDQTCEQDMMSKLLPVIMKKAQERKALPPVETETHVAPTMLPPSDEMRKSLSRSGSREMENGPCTHDNRETKAGSFELIEDPCADLPALTKGKIDEDNKKIKSLALVDALDSGSPTSNDDSPNNAFDTVVTKRKSKPSYLGGNPDVGNNEKFKSCKLQCNLRMDARIKITDQPIRCLHKTKDKDKRTVIISCSGCYGDNESILKWRKIPTEKIWTNEPVYEICSETNRPKIPSYLQKVKSNASSESLTNSPYFSKKARSLSSPSN